MSLLLALTLLWCLSVHCSINSFLIETLNSVLNMPLRQVRTILTLLPFGYFFYILYGYAFHICVPNGISVFLHNCHNAHRRTRLKKLSEHMWRKLYTHFVILFFASYPVYYKVPVLQNWHKAPKHFIKMCPTLEISITETRCVLKISLVNSYRNSCH